MRSAVVLAAALLSTSCSSKGAGLPDRRGSEVAVEAGRSAELAGDQRQGRESLVDRDQERSDLPRIADLDPTRFPKTPFGCMGTQGTLALLGQRGNVAIFSGCPGAGATTYLLVWGGQVSSLPSADVTAIKDKVDAAVIAIPGVWGHSISSCCVPSTNKVCSKIYVSSNTTSVWELAHQLDIILAGEPSCFGIMAEVPGPLPPRCIPKPTEPCQPIPICGGLKSPGCCDAPAYDPGATRVPVSTPTGSVECDHDGECMLNGCGSQCSAYNEPSVPGPCYCLPALQHAFCGCVGRECLWYEQK